MKSLIFQYGIALFNHSGTNPFGMLLLGTFHGAKTGLREVLKRRNGTSGISGMTMKKNKMKRTPLTLTKKIGNGLKMRMRLNLMRRMKKMKLGLLKLVTSCLLDRDNKIGIRKKSPPRRKNMERKEKAKDIRTMRNLLPFQVKLQMKTSLITLTTPKNLKQSKARSTVVIIKST